MNLPATSADYLTNFRLRAFDDTIFTKADLEAVISELDEALFQYPEIAERLTGMKQILVIGLKFKDIHYFKKRELTAADVQNALL